jgi:hypothetical protein
VVKLFAACLLAAAGLLAADTPVLLFSPAEAERLRAAVSRSDAWTTGAARALREDAARNLTAGPWSVTHQRPAGMKIDVHDYYSEGPYWWPDPAKPGGPYIRRDGRTNPDRFTANKNALTAMSEAVLALGAAAWFFNEPKFGDRAVLVLRAWFVDPGTRMNPHLEYGQAVRGHNTGRAAGLIDTRGLIRVVQGVRLLERTGRLDAATRDGVRRWFAEFNRWMTTSKNGVGEKKSGNNHASWWTAQVAAYADMAGDPATQEMAFRWFREELFPKQIRPDGAAPREESRTKSLGYSAFNLEAYTVLCRIASRRGVDLWGTRTREGASIATVVDFLLPSLRDPRQWKKEQIANFDSDGMYYLGLAGEGLKKPEYVRAFRERARLSSAWLALMDLAAGE